MFSRILISTDLTDGAARSLKLALALARGGQATVTLVHVVQHVAGLPPREMRAFYDRLVKKSRRRLPGASKLFAARGITVRSQILIGDRRRFLVTSLAGALVGPLVARAQPAKLPTIGFLGPNTPSLDSHRVGAFVQRLRELGWIEGRNVAIEYRWGEGRVERLAEIAAELVRLKVDVIVTSATRPVVAAKQATSVIPIVFAAVGDPVGTGLVASLARPGGNVTGLSLQATDLAAKRTGLLREVVPGLRRLAIMANSDTRAAVVEMREVQATARTLGFEVVTSEIRRPEDIAPAFEALKGRAEALMSATTHS